MSVVIDSSAALAWLYPDETTAPVRQVFELVAAQGGVVPIIWRLEVANGLTIGIRRHRVSPAFRTDALAALAMEPIEVDQETGTYAWTTIVQVADRFNLTVYDAAYLELAHRRSLPLASLDRELRDAAQALGVPLLGL